MRIHGNEYPTNDLVAFSRDLHVITECGFQIQPLHTVVNIWSESPDLLGDSPIVALTCDDGSDFDAIDLPHPTWGVQRSVLGILTDHRERHRGSQPHLHVTSFVIVSPCARAELDRTCMVGKGWWNEGWWASAIDSALMGIGNHSWDHNHETLGRPCDGLVPSGTFTSVDSYQAAEFEIRQADEYLRARAPNPAAALFAYPYGETNPFLFGDYLPSYRPALGAAFTTEPGYLTRKSERWRMPRFMCGRDWTTPEGLREILRRARPA